MDAPLIRILIRRKLLSGRLSGSRGPHVDGNPATGEMCDACQQPVPTEHLVMEGLADETGTRRLRFHLPCFYLWDEERTKLAQNGVVHH